MIFFVIIQTFTEVIPDFQVNQEDYISKTVQVFPAIANYDSGGIVIWSDMRMWPDIGMKMIFGTRLNASCDTIGANFVVNDDLIIPCGLFSDIGADFYGNSFAVWNQNENVVGRRFYYDGSPVDSSFIINDSPGNCYHSYIDVDSTCRAVIVWADGREGQARVYCQIYDETGIPIGVNFPVSDSSQYRAMQSNVSITGDKGFVVVWEYDWDIWCQRFDSLGNKIGENFMIREDTLSIDEDDPAVKCTKNGHFLVTWATHDAENVFCRLFDPTASPITDVIKLNELSLINSWKPKATIFQDSLWYVVWQDSAIFLQRISSSGTLVGDNIQINEPIGKWHHDPDIDATNSNLFITWVRRIFYSVFDIMVQQVTPAGSLVGQNRIITDNKGGSPQRRPDIVADTTGYFFIVWDDARNPEHMSADQYGRRFDAQGTPLGDDFRVNDYINATNASIALNNLGLYVTVWARSYPDSTSQIYSQRFDRNGISLGPNTQISLGPGDSYIDFPKIETLSDNSFVVVWADGRILPARIYGRVLDQLGIPQGDEFITYIDSMANNQAWSIVDEGNGRFLLGMTCDIDSIGVAIREYNYAALPLSDPIILNETPASNKIVSGAKGLHKYLFVWAGFDDINIYGQLLNDSLHRIGNNFLINDDTLSYSGCPSVAADENGSFLVIWHEWESTDLDVYGQFLDSLGNKIGGNFKVDNDTTAKNQWQPSCYSENNLIYIVWSDDRVPSHGYDIYCKIIEWPEIGVSEKKNAAPPTSITIAPNPFRSKLHIILGSAQNAKSLLIKIYDVSRRLIKELELHSTISNLTSTITWDGTDKKGNVLPAGVYFVRFKGVSENMIRKVVKVE